MVVGWRIGLTQCRTATEVKHGRARSGVGCDCTGDQPIINSATELLRAIVPGATH